MDLSFQQTLCRQGQSFDDYDKMMERFVFWVKINSEYLLRFDDDNKSVCLIIKCA